MEMTRRESFVGLLIAQLHRKHACIHAWVSGSVVFKMSPCALAYA